MIATVRSVGAKVTLGVAAGWAWSVAAREIGVAAALILLVISAIVAYVIGHRGAESYLLNQLASQAIRAPLNVALFGLFWPYFVAAYQSAQAAGFGGEPRNDLIRVTTIATIALGAVIFVPFAWLVGTRADVGDLLEEIDQNFFTSLVVRITTGGLCLIALGGAVYARWDVTAVMLGVAVVNWWVIRVFIPSLVAH